MEMDSGQKEERWHEDARQALIKMKIHLFMLSHGFTYDQRNHESWLESQDKMGVQRRKLICLCCHTALHMTNETMNRGSGLKTR